MKKFAVTHTRSSLVVNTYHMGFWYDCPLAILYVGTLWGISHRNVDWIVHGLMDKTLKDYR